MMRVKMVRSFTPPAKIFQAHRVQMGMIRWLYDRP
jgi:hypothetical protein